MSVTGDPARSIAILLVEDDPLIRTLSAELLTELGHTVLGAGSGAGALKILEESPVDVLMADLGLPDMSGVRLALEARRRLPNLGVIIATGGSSLAAAGDEDAVFLRKPWDEADFIQALNKSLKSQRPQ